MSVDLDLHDIEKALAESFRARGELVDPAVAESIAELARQEAAARRDRGRRGRGITRAALLAAAAGVGGIVVLESGVFRNRDDARDPAGTRSPTTAPSEGVSLPGKATDENVRAARAEVDRLFGLVPVLPGSTVDNAPPRDAFAFVADGWPKAAEPRGVERVAFLRAPGSLDEAASFYALHAPAGWIAGRGWDESTGGASPPRRSTVSVTYSVGPGADTAAYVRAGVDIGLVPYADGIALRVRARALARPGRDEGGYVTGTVTSVTVSPTIALTRKPAPWTTITDPALIADLVGTLNALPMDSPLYEIIHGCRVILAGDPTGARLTLHRGRERDLAVVADWSCGETISIDGQAPLDGSDRRWLAVRSRLVVAPRGG